MPDKKRYAPKDVGLAEVGEITFEGRGGVTLIAWYLPARRGKPTLLYFTGNSGSAANRARARSRRSQRAAMARSCSDDRRFGGSGGWPTEANNIADAVAQRSGTGDSADGLLTGKCWDESGGMHGDCVST